MKSLILLFTSLLALTSLQGRTLEAGTHDCQMHTEGLEREYKLYIPENLPSGAPLVVVLHGYGGTNNPARFGMNAVADRHKFAVCYPLGTKDGRGKQCWNAGYPFQEGMQVDDVDFITRLVHKLQREEELSQTDVFCTGMSNGGEMCYQLAVERPRLFAAVAPVSGLMLEWLYKADRSTIAVPLFEIHGTADKTSAWEGDSTNAGGWGAYLPVPLAIGHWVSKARCTTIKTDTLAGRNPDNGRKIIRHRYAGGTDGCEVWLYEIVGGHHSWGEEDLDTGEELWKFFSKFRE